MSVRRAQREISSREFVEWVVYLDQEVNEFHRQDYFLANIAKTIKEVNATNPSAVTIDEFLLKFATHESKDTKLTPDKQKSRMERSKSMWLALAGVGDLSDVEDSVERESD